MINPLILYNHKAELTASTFQKQMLISVMYSISGVIICFHGARLLQSFQKDTVFFKQIAKSLKIIASCIIAGTLCYTLIDYVYEQVIDTAFWIKTLGNVLLLGLTGFFFIAISVIINRADYYKTQNDLTI